MEYKQLQLKNLKEIAGYWGKAPAYLFNVERFTKNFIDLQNEFRKIYPNTHIAYSYKTNHIPGICKIVDELGGYAEVVSPTESQIAVDVVGCKKNRVIYNGIIPDNCMLEIICSNGIVNVESREGLQYVIKKAPKRAKIGIRIGYPDSRFGFKEDEISWVLQEISEAGLHLAGIHCHVGGSRSLKTWEKKTEDMVRIAGKIETVLGYPLEYIDLGGHLYGRMDAELKEQFGDDIPSFKDYAETVATIMRDAVKDADSMPKLILEPGTALIADAISVLATVETTGFYGGTASATLNVSSFDCGMIADYKNLTIENITQPGVNFSPQRVFGYTCMEEDYISRCCTTLMAPGDRVLIHNCGAYSISMKGNFITPPMAMYMVNDSYELLGKLRDRSDVTDIVKRCLIGGALCLIV